MANILLDLAGYTFVISFVILMGMGYANKIIIFNDQADYIRTLLLAICLACLYFALYVVVEPSFVLKFIIIPLMVIAAVVLFCDCLILSIKNNGHFFWGTVIALYRLIYLSLTIAIAIILALPSRNKNGEINISRTLFGFALASGIAYSSILLINGHKVEASLFDRRAN